MACGPSSVASNPFGLGGSEERIEEFTPENDPFGGY